MGPTTCFRRIGVGLWFCWFLGACSSDSEPEVTAPCTQPGLEGRLMCGDFGPLLGTVDELVVVGRAVTEEPGFDLAAVTPNDDLTQEELPDLRLTLGLSATPGGTVHEFSATTDDDGWVSARLDLGASSLEPGSYTLDVKAGSYWLASVPARLLEPDYAERVVVSDIDLTYLDTDFQSADAILELLDQTASDRRALPAMPVVYQGLRDGERDDENRPVTFLSGSPLFFRRVLAGRMALDGVKNDGVALKPIKLLLIHELLDGFESEEWWQALAGDPSALLGSALDQVGYKLTSLFAQQLNLPGSARLVLLGDDAEMDHVTYALFHRTLAGELAVSDLIEELDELDVDSLWQEAIERVAPLAVARRTPVQSPVDGIFINQTDVPNTEQPAFDWRVAGLSRHHRGAWPLSLELFETGLVHAGAVEGVRQALVSDGATQAELDAAEAAAIDEGFLSQP